MFCAPLPSAVSHRNLHYLINKISGTIKSWNTEQHHFFQVHSTLCSIVNKLKVSQLQCEQLYLLLIKEENREEYINKQVTIWPWRLVNKLTGRKHLRDGSFDKGNMFLASYLEKH